MAAEREPVLDENALNIFTDGSSYGSPRRGGYAFRIKTLGDNGYWVDRDEQPYGVAGGTNQEMELVAVIEALNFVTGKRSPYDLRDFSKVVVYTDSLYVKNNVDNALYRWPTTDWCDRNDNPIVNAALWKDLVKAIFRTQPKRVYFEWVKGHKASTDNRVVDKLAKASAKGPLHRPLKVERPRRKLTDKKTEAGSIRCEGQRITLRVVTERWLREQKVGRYRCEVVSKASPYLGNVDWLYSHELLKSGHTYYVRLDDELTRPWIVKMFHEVKPKESETKE
jgi:ribonuclease HI